MGSKWILKPLVEFEDDPQFSAWCGLLLPKQKGKSNVPWMVRFEEGGVAAPSDTWLARMLARTIGGALQPTVNSRFTCRGLRGSHGRRGKLVRVLGYTGSEVNQFRVFVDEPATEKGRGELGSCRYAFIVEVYPLRFKHIYVGSSLGEPRRTGPEDVHFGFRNLPVAKSTQGAVPPLGPGQSAQRSKSSRQDVSK